MAQVEHFDERRQLILDTMGDLDLLLETILIRRSTRTFVDEPLGEHHIELIETYLGTTELLRGPLGKTFRIEFLQKGPMKDNAKIGTYGYVKNPPAYLVGMAPNDKYALFEIAYVFHGLVLFLTSQGVGTCWLGGIFNQDDVRASTHVADSEIVPAISPIGYTSDKKHIFGKLAGRLLKPHKRRPVEEIAFFGDFSTPFTNTKHPIYEKIRLGTLAPNAQNKQSWRVVVSKDYSRVDLYVKFKLKKQVHGNFRGYACPPEYLDIGIFYRHFDTAMKAEGAEGHLEVNDPGFEMPNEEMEYIITWVRDE